MATTAVSYFKRYKMEAELRDLPPPALPPGFDWLSWSEGQLPAHAEVLYESFHQEIDAIVFPSLATFDGCVTLMTVVSRRLNFLAGATWLVVGPTGPCGAIQGLHERGSVGAIQNLGVSPAWRGRGIGEALVLQALHGFQRAGLARGLLEVTGQNETAQRLYRRLGFRRIKTLYKAVPETMHEER
ncbi:MAG TPA: N-acetyltransferase [Gemmataceae bacterium]|nr:N-acetyltransferase [Gemmataceae bacterium]